MAAHGAAAAGPVSIRSADVAIGALAALIYVGEY